MNKYEKELSNIKVDRIYTKNLQELVERATPPPVEVVCEALSEYLSRKVFYDNKHFIIKYGVAIVWLDKDNNIEFSCITLPPHLITLIGRFYEGLK